MTEWSNVSYLKYDVLPSTIGSNPILSVTQLNKSSIIISVLETFTQLLAIILLVYLH